MSAAWPVRRPTEVAGIRNAIRSQRPLPPVEVLLDHLVTAYGLRDRRGVQLVGLAVVRATGGPWRPS